MPRSLDRKQLRSLRWQKAETLVTYQAKGYGLKNVNDRIRLLYGESYGIQIYSAPGEGTTVIMRFPKEIRNYEE